MSILLKFQQVEELAAENVWQSGVCQKLLQFGYEMVTGGFY
jgi:hypothetical protein